MLCKKRVVCKLLVLTNGDKEYELDIMGTINRYRFINPITGESHVKTESEIEEAIILDVDTYEEQRKIINELLNVKNIEHAVVVDDDYGLCNPYTEYEIIKIADENLREIADEEIKGRQQRIKTTQED